MSQTDDTPDIAEQMARAVLLRDLSDDPEPIGTGLASFEPRRVGAVMHAPTDLGGDWVLRPVLEFNALHRTTDPESGQAFSMGFAVDVGLTADQAAYLGWELLASSIEARLQRQVLRWLIAENGPEQAGSIYLRFRDHAAAENAGTRPTPRGGTHDEHEGQPDPEDQRGTEDGPEAPDGPGAGPEPQPGG